MITFYFLIAVLQMTGQDEPSMEKWTKAWHDSDTKTLVNLYAENASVFPPNKETITGNQKIVEYFKGGFGKVDVYFQLEIQKVTDSVAYEFGEFRDVNWGTQELREKGKYAITWIKEEGQWKILCHTFSIGFQ